MIWPHASIDITMERIGTGHRISWYFIWPEYYLLAFGLPVLFGLAYLGSGFKRMDFSTVLIFFLFSFVFFGLLIFLDTLWVSSRVRRTFERL